MTRRLLVSCVLVVTTCLLVSQPVFAQEAGGERYAILIGVRKYDPNQLRSLEYTENDVTELADVLKASGYRAENVVLMTQKVGAEELRFLPLAAQIRKELALLLNECGAKDSLLIALAGHGVQFEGSEESFFCPADAKLTDKNTLISLTELYRQMEACKAECKVMLVDACRNDPRSDNSLSGDNVRLESVTRPQKRKPPTGVAAYFSCAAGEKAYQDSELRHGIFFHYVIEGLRGAAADAQDGEISLSALEAFVSKRVRSLARVRYGVEQKPQLLNNNVGTLPLVRIDHGVKHLTDGTLHLERAEWELGVGAFSKAIAFNSNLALAHSRRGVCYNALGDHANAEVDHSRALELDAGLALSWAGRAEARAQLQKFDEALADANKALELDPQAAAAFRVRGLIHWSKEDADSSFRDYDEALRLDPKFLKALEERAAHHRAKENLDAAVADYTSALELSPDKAELHNGRGRAHHTLKNLDQALADLTRAVELAPKDPNYWFDRGDLHNHSLTKDDEAIADYTEAIRLDPKFQGAYHNRGICYWNKSDTAAALRDFTEALRISENSSAISFSARGNLHKDLKQFDAAIADYTEVLRLTPDDAGTHHARGQAYEGAQLLDEALADLTKAIELAPENADFRYARAEFYSVSLNQYDDAIADYTEAIRLNPQFQAAYHGRGLAYWDKDDTKAALRDLNAALHIAEHASTYCARANLYFSLGKYDKAIADYSAGIRLTPEDASLYLFRSRAYTERGLTAEAEADLEKALELDPEVEKKNP